MLEAISKTRVLPVVVIDAAALAVPLAEALLAGGLPSIEITLRTPAALQAIAAIRQALPQMLVGAGTILSEDQLEEAEDAGAQFGVSPGLNAAVVARAHEIGLPFFPGVMTPGEVERARAAGCHVLKFFPAEAAGGVTMLQALAGPYAHTGVKFIPTGGIKRESLGNYLALPIVAAVGGSWLAEKKLLAAKDWPAITALAADAVRTAEDAKPKA
jgi:2-dehydro-3-deoxyphosphogluconate aldolase / (4S)-4-hydroxy-2-oxoglutarate aldolase